MYIHTWREVSPGPEGNQLEALPEYEEAGEKDGAAVEAPEGGVAGGGLRQLYHSRYLTTKVKSLLNLMSLLR